MAHWWDNLLAAFGAMAEPLREAAPVAYDPDERHTAEQVGSAYARRLTGPNPRRDLDPTSADKTRDLANALYLTNPLAKRGIEINRDWIMGEGMAVTVEPDQRDIARRDRQPMQEANDISGRARARQQERQEIVDRFWTDPANRLDSRLYDYVLGLGLFGEFLFTCAVNPTNGAVKLGIVDPGRIHRVVTDPLNSGRPLAVELKPPTAGQPPPRLKHIQVVEDVADPRFGRLCGALPGETYVADGETRTYAGSCALWAINKAPTAERGTSDLAPVIDFMDAIDQMHFAEVDRSLLAKSYVWDVMLTGAGPTDVQNKTKELKDNPPKPGSVRVHNERETWAAVQPNLNQWDYVSGVEVLVNHIAAGLGIPKGWVNGVQDVNKAQATEMAEPTMKRFEARQRFIMDKLEELCSFALDQAELAGRIARRRNKPGILPEAWPLKVTAPEIRAKDIGPTAKAISDAANALRILITDSVIPVETAREVAKAMLTDLGVEMDIETAEEQIAAADKQAQAQDAAQLDAQTQAQIAVRQAAPAQAAPVRRAG